MRFFWDLPLTHVQKDPHLDVSYWWVATGMVETNNNPPRLIYLII